MKHLRIPGPTSIDTRNVRLGTGISTGWARGQRAAVLALLACMATPLARAVDGCQVLLCLAAPSWRAIPQCVPAVTQVLRDLARGRRFPVCAMAGAGNSASHTWSSAPHACPPQYTRVQDGPNGPVYSCGFDGAIAVTVDGDLFTTTWWSIAGDTVTAFSPNAKARLGHWDPRFDDDLAAWLARQPVEAHARD